MPSIGEVSDRSCCKHLTASGQSLGCSGPGHAPCACTSRLQEISQATQGMASRQQYQPLDGCAGRVICKDSQPWPQLRLRPNLASEVPILPAWTPLQWLLMVALTLMKGAWKAAPRYMFALDFSHQLPTTLAAILSVMRGLPKLTAGFCLTS